MIFENIRVCIYAVPSTSERLRSIYIILKSKFHNICKLLSLCNLVHFKKSLVSKVNESVWWWMLKEINWCKNVNYENALILTRLVTKNIVIVKEINNGPYWNWNCKCAVNFFVTIWKHTEICLYVSQMRCERSQYRILWIKYVHCNNCSVVLRVKKSALKTKPNWIENPVIIYSPSSCFKSVWFSLWYFYFPLIPENAEKVNGYQQLLVTHILFCVQQKIETLIGLEQVEGE